MSIFTHRTTSLLAIACCLYSCASTEIGESKDVNQASIYQSYKISLNERHQQCHVFAQFRFAGEKGTTLVLSAPSNINFDGHVLGVDSLAISGAYYDSTLSPQVFEGPHRFVFTDCNQKRYSNEVKVVPLKLVSVIEAADVSRPLRLRFQQAYPPALTTISVSAGETDSSFTIRQNAGTGFTEIEIPTAELQRQTSNSLTLYATMEANLPLQEQTPEKGSLQIVHDLPAIKIKLVGQPKANRVVAVQ